MLKNGIYNIIGATIRASLAFLIIPILIRFMGIEEYGVWTLASSAIAILGLAEAGLSVSATVFASQDLARQDNLGFSQTLTIVVGAMLLLATLIALLLWGGADKLIDFFPNLESSQRFAVTQSWRIGAIVIWTQLLQQVLIGIEQSYQDYKRLNLLKSLQWIFLTIGWAYIAWLGGKAIALMQWQMFVSVLSCLSHSWMVILLAKQNFIKPSWNWSRGVEITRYSFMTWLISLGGTLFARGDRLIVANVLDSSRLGVYSAIVDLTGAINFFSAQPIQPLLPTISHLMVEDEIRDQPLLKSRLKTAIQVNAVVATLVGGLLLVLARPILKIIFSDDSLVSNYVLMFQAMVVITTIYSLNATGYFILLGLKETNTATFNIIMSGFSSLLFIYIGSSHYGLFGSIIGNIGYIGTLVLPIAAMRKLDLPTGFFMAGIKLPILCFFATGLYVFMMECKLWS